MRKIALFCILAALLAMPITPGRANQTTANSENLRIGLLYPQALGLAFILNLQDQLVCVPHFHLGLKNTTQDFYQAMAPDLINTDNIGQPTSPNIESLLRVKPDLLVVSDTNQHASTAVDMLHKNGIKIIKLNAGFGTVDEWLEAVNQLGATTGRTTRAQAYESFFRSKIRLVTERLAAVPMHQRPKVALINTNGTQMIIRGSRTTYGYDLIELAGGRLMEKGDDPGDSAGCAELLFAFDPDIIIDDSKIDIFYKSEWWNFLRAVKENKVYKTPADDSQAWVTNWFLSTYSPLGILWLAKKFHPEKFADIDLQKEHAEFCRLLYNREFTHSGTGLDGEL